MTMLSIKTELAETAQSFIPYDEYKDAQKLQLIKAHTKMVL